MEDDSFGVLFQAFTTVLHRCVFSSALLLTLSFLAVSVSYCNDGVSYHENEGARGDAEADSMTLKTQLCSLRVPRKRRHDVACPSTPALK
ncbi:hypothetical protein KIN20_003093, partial [Parelaphostrongylus tenuis]